MDLKVSNVRGARALMALLTLTAGAGALHATNSLTTTTSGAVTCNLATGPGTSESIVVKAVTPLTGSNTITVTASLPQQANGLTVTPLSGSLTSAANSSVTFTVSSTTGCGGGSGAVVTQVTFNGAGSASVGAVSAANVNVTDTVTSPYLLNAVVSGSVTCGTASGVGAAATITLTPFTPLTGSNTIVVTNAAVGNGLALSPPNGGTTLSSSVTSLVYTINAASGCAGSATASTPVQFLAGGNNDVKPNVSVTVTVNGSPLIVSPSSITIQCLYNGNGASTAGNYTPPASAQTISVTSAVPGGWPVSLDTGAGKTPPSWLTLVTTNLPGSASATAVTFTVNAAAGCGLGGQTTHSTTLYLSNGAAPDVAIPVTLQNNLANPLTVAPTSIRLSYTKGSGTIASANATVSSTVANAFISINSASLPGWLTVDNITGAAPWAVHFSTTSLAASLAPGTYTAAVSFQVSGYQPASLPVTLQVNNSAPTFTVTCQPGVSSTECNPSSPTQVNLSWTLGGAIPSYTITAYSSDSPIQYSVASGGTLDPTLVNASQQSGLAYSFGTEIPVTFPSSVFSTAQPGQVLTGTVTFTWGSPASTTVITFSLSVLSPGATLSSITPATLPTAVQGTQFMLTLTGTGFVGGSNANLATRIGIVQNGSITQDTNLSLNVYNASNMVLTVTVPTGNNDPLLPFANGGTVVLGIANGSNIPTGTATLTITNGPIIQAATSSSSFTEVTAPALPTFAPYDLITLWGAAFCSGTGTACGSNTILVGSPDAVTERYPTSVGPVSGDSLNRVVSVNFYQHGSPTEGALIASAPILFATNGQINLIVPSEVGAFPGAETVDIVVSYGPTSGSGQVLKSSSFPINIAAADPGIFTIGSDGQGQGAVLDSNWNLVTSSNPAGVRSGSSDSDIVHIFVTGLGAPDSVGSNSMSSPNYTYPTDCISALGDGQSSDPVGYLALLNAATGAGLTSIDGAVIQTGLLASGMLSPCFANNTETTVKVMVGGQPATVKYAGFTPDTVAGLYQVDALLPATGAFNSPPAAAVQMPIQVSIGQSTVYSSQSGVTMWVAPKLYVSATGVNSSGMTAALASGGTAYAQVGTQVNALATVTADSSQGTAPFVYSVTSGLLPTGMTLNASTGVISGRAQLGTSGNYLVTVSATDSAATPLTGSITFTINVAGGLYLSSTAQTSATYGTAVPTLTTVSATGGATPYTFSTTLGFSDNSGNPLQTSPTGMTINGTTGVISTTAATLAGTYNVTVTATDANGLTGSLTFPIVIALNVTEAAGTGDNLYVITATGLSGTPLYVISGDGATAGLEMSSNDVVIGNASGNTPVTTTVTVTDSVTLAPGAAAEGTGSVTWSATP